MSLRVVSTTLRSAAVLASIVVLAAPGSAAAQNPGTPEAIARRFFAAVAAEQWDSAAKLLDVRPILEERDRQLMRARSNEDVGVTPQELMAYDSTLTLAEATTQAAIIERQRKTHPPNYVYSFSGVRDTAELRALTPQRAAVAWLMRGDIRVHAREAQAAAHCPVPPQGAFPNWPPHTIIGVIENGDDAYVLHRDPYFARGDEGDYAGVHRDVPPILLLHRTRGEWRIVPSDGMMMGAAVSFVSDSHCPSL